MTRTTGKRNNPSLFDDDGDGKIKPQTSLYSFFAPSKPKHTTKKPRRPPPARVSQSPKAAATNKEQMYLDLGQRNFGTAECRLCGMLFVHGLQQDTETHAKVCEDYKRGVAFSNRIKCRAIEQSVPRSRCTIVEVRPSDSSPVAREKVHAAASIAYAELGFSTNASDGKTSNAQRTAYMYIAEQRIVGLCLMEQVTQAHRLELQNDTTTTPLTRASTPEEAVLGVHLLWVHKTHRRQGIAQALVRAACERMVYGYIVPPEKVAVSSPTTAGTLFAQRFCGRSDVLVYDCV